MAVVDEMLYVLGLEEERFRLVWCSSAEADKFVGAVREMTETIRNLGPSAYRQMADLRETEPLRGREEVAACQSR